jgi:hypothetical protein
LAEEEGRVQMYLHASTHKPLVQTCETVLVKGHTTIIWEEFQNLLNQDKQEDLFRMYSLLLRIPEGLEPLRTRFETHVRKAGLSAIEKIAGETPETLVRLSIYLFHISIAINIFDGHINQLKNDFNIWIYIYIYMDNIGA